MYVWLVQRIEELERSDTEHLVPLQYPNRLQPGQEETWKSPPSVEVERPIRYNEYSPGPDGPGLSLITRQFKDMRNNRHILPGSKDRVLLSKPVPGDRCTIALDILIAQISEQATSATNQLEQASSGMVILTMQTQVGCKPIDTLCQQGDLHFRRTGIGLVRAIRGNDLFFLCWLQRHAGEASSDRKAVAVVDACIMKKTPVAMALDVENYSTLDTSFTKPTQDATNRDCLSLVSNGTMIFDWLSRHTIGQLQPFRKRNAANEYARHHRRQWSL